MAPSRLAGDGRSLGAEQADRQEGKRELDHGEQGQRSADADVKHLTEYETAEPEAEEQREHVEAHSLPRPGATERGNDAREQRLRRVISKREHRHGYGRHDKWRVRDQGRSPDGTEGETERQERTTTMSIGHSADHRTEQETWDAIAKQGQPDTNRTEAVTLLEVEPEPREHPGVKHRVRQYEAVGTCAADPPPMKWSALWYGFEPGGRIDVEEATQA